jgi:hypothetical protein
MVRHSRPSTRRELTTWARDAIADKAADGRPGQRSADGCCTAAAQRAADNATEDGAGCGTLGLAGTKLRLHRRCRDTQCERCADCCARFVSQA